MRYACFHLKFADPQRDFAVPIGHNPPTATSGGRRYIPDWAALGRHQCDNCPLACSSFKCCPPAYDMIDVVERCSGLDSFESVTLQAFDNGETNVLRTDLQRALSYVFLAIVASSACPRAYLLSPLSKFGKAFPDLDDVFFYTLSFGLIRNRLFNSPLVKAEDDAFVTDEIRALASVFHGLLLRVKEASPADANINAMIRNLQASYVMLHPKTFYQKRLKKYFTESNSIEPTLTGGMPLCLTA